MYNSARKSRQDLADVDGAPQVQFVIGDGQILSLPIFVTKTTLNALLADEQGNDARACQQQ